MAATRPAAKAKKLGNLQRKRYLLREAKILKTRCVQKAFAEERRQRKAADARLEGLTARSNTHFRARGGGAGHKIKAVQADLVAAKKREQQSAKKQAQQYAMDLAEKIKELAGKTSAINENGKTINHQTRTLASMGDS